MLLIHRLLPEFGECLLASLTGLSEGSRAEKH